MKGSFYPPRREKRSLSVLVLGGKYEFDQLALRYEESRLDRHILFLATCMKAAWEILSTNQVDRIVIEAFMENAENERIDEFKKLRGACRLCPQLASFPSHVDTSCKQCH
jgi:hypothetical protein